MKLRWLPVWGIMCLASCKPAATPPAGNTFEQLEKMADSLQTMAPEIRETHWRQSLQTAAVLHDTTSIVYAHYQLAKSAAKSKPDSAEYHIGEALRQLGPGDANDVLRFMLYNGAGIVAEQQRKYLQAAWFYNASAAIVLNGQAPGTKPLAKVICLLNAGQYNTKQGQHTRAIGQMQTALRILQDMPQPSPKHLFRAQSQLFTAMAEDGAPVDSLRPILQNIQHLARQTGDTLQLRFSEDHAGLYYTRARQFDSALFHYNRLRALDEAGLAAHQPIAPRNLYMTLANLVSLEVGAGRLKDARSLMHRAKELERGLSDDERALGLKALSELQFAQNDVQAAQVTTATLLQLKDEISRNAGIQSAAELDALYELQAKDRTIVQMDRQVTETGEALAMQRLLLLLAVLTGVLAVSWLVMAYYLQRQRRLRQEQAGVLLQQQLLRAQMEPHFIFNTLGALQHFIRFNEQEKAIRYLEHFSRLLRSNLELSRQSFAPLTEEIEALENYLALQQMRFDQAFQYEIRCNDPDTEGVFVPPMLIQPFVENAILHGIRLMGEQGMVRIDVEVEEKCVIVRIEDNGSGMTGAKKVKEHPSLSGTIARERLTMLADEEGLDAGLEIIEGNPGTIVRLVLPARNGS